MSISGGQIDPHLRRWMSFVDGENFTIRGQKVAIAKGMNLEEGEWFSRNVFMWLPSRDGRSRPDSSVNRELEQLQPRAIRSYYYTSVAGDPDRLNAVRDSIHHLAFNPVVFKKNAQEEKAKGVDIALTKDMLMHAVRDNYDVALLFAGDGDYVPLVEQVKSLGKVVYVGFFEREGLNAELRRAADFFFDITHEYVRAWAAVKVKVVEG